jgi:hypothetical protein
MQRKRPAKKDKDTDIVNTLLDDMFRILLIRLIQFLKLINKAIHMSEDCHADLGKVTIHWKEVEKHLLDAVTEKPFGNNIETLTVLNCRTIYSDN